MVRILFALFLAFFLTACTKTSDLFRDEAQVSGPGDGWPNLSANYDASSGCIVLSWAAAPENPEYFIFKDAAFTEILDRTFNTQYSVCSPKPIPGETYVFGVRKLQKELDTNLNFIRYTVPKNAPVFAGVDAIYRVSHQVIQLDWTPARGTVTEYRVYEGSDFSRVKLTVKPEVQQVLIDGLNPNATYSFAVRAFNKDENDGNTRVLSATTFPDERPLFRGIQKVENISGLDANDNPLDGTSILKLSWEAATAPNLVGYQVFMSSTSDGFQFASPVQGLPGSRTGYNRSYIPAKDAAGVDVTSVEVPNLDPGASYHFVVRALMDVSGRVVFEENRMWKKGETFRELPPEAPIVISSILPNIAPFGRPVSVRIKGPSFPHNIVAELGTFPCQGISRTLASDGQVELSCMVTAVSAQTNDLVVDVRVQRVDTSGNRQGVPGLLARGFTFTSRPPPSGITFNPQVIIANSSSPVRLTLNGNDLFEKSGSVPSILIGDKNCASPRVDQRNGTLIAQMSCQLPSLPPGFYRVQVTNPDGQSAEAATLLVSAEQPIIDEISPKSGSPDLSTVLTLIGRNFSVVGVSNTLFTVTIGSGTCAFTSQSVTGRSDGKQELRCNTPLNSNRDQYGAPLLVTLRDNNQRQAEFNGFTFVPSPQIDGFDNNLDSGPVDGGNPITLRGRNFLNDSTLTFNGVECVDKVVSGNGTLLTCNKVPASVAGAVNVPVFVTNPGNPQIARFESYRYMNPPTIQRVYNSADQSQFAKRGSGTINLILEGLNLSKSPNISLDLSTLSLICSISGSVTESLQGNDRYNSIPCSVDSTNALVGLYDIKLKTSSGEPATLSKSFSFTNAPPLEITFVTPTLSSPRPVELVVRGQYFTYGGNTVRAIRLLQGGTRVDCPITSTSNTELKCQPPSGLKSQGNYLVEVERSDLQKQSYDGVFFAPSFPPMISDFTPKFGSKLGSNTVSILGKNLCIPGLSKPDVTFGSRPVVQERDCKIVGSADGNGDLPSLIIATIDGPGQTPAGDISATITVTLKDGYLGGTGQRAVTTNSYVFRDRLNLSMTPSSGSFAGGNRLTFTASEALPTSDISVKIDGQDCSGVQVAANAISCIAPAFRDQEGGPAPVTVTVASIQASVLPAIYTYNPPVVLTAAYPQRVRNNSSVVILGRSFSNKVRVRWMEGYTEVQSEVTSRIGDNRLNATAPTGPADGRQLDIQVINLDDNEAQLNDSSILRRAVLYAPATYTKVKTLAGATEVTSGNRSALGFHESKTSADQDLFDGISGFAQHTEPNGTTWYFVADENNHVIRRFQKLSNGGYGASEVLIGAVGQPSNQLPSLTTRIAPGDKIRLSGPRGLARISEQGKDWLYVMDAGNCRILRTDLREGAKPSNQTSVELFRLDHQQAAGPPIEKNDCSNAAFSTLIQGFVSVGTHLYIADAGRQDSAGKPDHTIWYLNTNSSSPAKLFRFSGNSGDVRISTVDCGSSSAGCTDGDFSNGGSIYRPGGLAAFTNASGDTELVFVQMHHSAIRSVNLRTGNISTKFDQAGPSSSCNSGFADIPTRLNANLTTFRSIAIVNDVLYFPDEFCHTVRAFDLNTNQFVDTLGNALTVGISRSARPSELRNPTGVFAESSNSILVAETQVGSYLRRYEVDQDGRFSRVTSLVAGRMDRMGQLQYAKGLATDGQFIYFVNRYTNEVLKSSIQDGSVSTLGRIDSSSQNKPEIRFGTHDGRYLYLSDTSNHVIYRVTTSSQFKVDIFAGTFGSPSYSCPSSSDDNQSPLMAKFTAPMGLATDGASLYVLDSGCSRIRKISLLKLNQGQVTTETDFRTGIRESGGSTTYKMCYPLASTGLTTDGSKLYWSTRIGPTTQDCMATHFSAILAYDLSTRSSSTVLAGSRTGSVVFNVSSDLSTDGSQVFLNQADGVRAFDNTNGSGFLGEDILWRAYWTPRQGYSILSVTLNNPSMVNTLLGYNPGANPQDYDLPRGDIDGDLSQTNLATKPKTLLPQNLLAWGGRVYLLNHWNLRYLE